MKVHNQPIPLANPKSADRLVKRSARALFTLVRSTAGQAQRVPGILSQATADVREAWAEHRIGDLPRRSPAAGEAAAQDHATGLETRPEAGHCRP